MATGGTPSNPQAQTVGRLPQTTQGIPAGGPFIRYAEEAVALAYTSVPAFGGVVNLPLTAVPGFLRHVIVKVAATAGSGANVPTLSADGPYNVISQLTLRDASGQPMFPAIDGFGLFLINLFSGQCVGQGGVQAPAALPSWTATTLTSGSGAGNFQFKLWVPLEFNSSGYCALPADNSAELPKLLIQLNGAATVYGTQPSTLPVLTFTIEEGYWAVPNNMPDLAPYDVGASAQWLLTVSGQNPPTAAYMRVLDQGVGQFVHTKIYVFRDSNNARQDDYPSTIEQWVDQFQYRFELNDDVYDRMAGQHGVGVALPAGPARPTGVIAYSWRDAIQQQVSKADDGEAVLVTTGSTKVELGGTWQTNANQPAQLTCYTGMIFPGPSGYPFGSQAA